MVIFQTEGRELQPSSFRTCPLCERAVPRALIERHVGTCDGASQASSCRKVDQGSAANLNLQPDESKQVPRDRQSQGDSQTTSLVKQHAPSAAGNALSFLMAEQREQSQVMVFFLEQLPDSTWKTYWWSKGPKSSAGLPAHHDIVKMPGSKSVWSSTTQMSSSIIQSTSTPASSSSKSKVTVQLHTNVAPGQEADLAQMTSTTPGADTFKGSPSLLKSALQKNVRLCRAAPAVR